MRRRSGQRTTSGMSEKALSLADPGKLHIMCFHQGGRSNRCLPGMSTNNDLKNYVQLRRKLELEKSQLETRLREITAALGNTSAPQQAAPTRETSVRRIKNPVSLRKGVVKLTTSKPLTKQEILDGLEKLGYRFTTKKPLN